MFLIFLFITSIILKNVDKITYDNALDYIAPYKSLIPYMDIEYMAADTVKTARVKFELFWEKTPKTALNFALLIKGYTKPNGSIIKYEGSNFHRLVKGFVIQGGDFTVGNGTGGESIYGEKFPDEMFYHKHVKGALSMANSGPNTNSSQFFITLKDVYHLDSRHVVFGKIKDEESMKIIEEIEKYTKVNHMDKPKNDVKIVKTGFENSIKFSL